MTLNMSVRRYMASMFLAYFDIKPFSAGEPVDRRVNPVFLTFTMFCEYQSYEGYLGRT